MPASIGPTGITIPAQAEVLGWLLNGYTSSSGASLPGVLQIYGAGINVASNSPDGQRLNLTAQIIADVYEFAAELYNSFAPGGVGGPRQDQLYAINGIKRNGGTFTLQNVAVTANQALTLPGLDIYPSSPFAVSDSAGNQYQLLVTSTLAIGSNTLAFQASQIGPISSAANSITSISTPTLGVTAVNNPATPTVTGQAQETDAAFRIRQANSVELPSLGYYDGLYGALLDIPGVNQVFIDENDTLTTNANGTPGNSIWVVIDAPSTLDAQIAQVIYTKRSMGCGTKGAISETVTRPNGQTVVINFDNPTAVQIYFKATVTPIAPASTVDITWLAQQILGQFQKYGINQSADASAIVAFIKSVAPYASVSVEGVCLTSGGSFVPLIAPAAVNDQFQMAGVGNIDLTLG